MNGNASKGIRWGSVILGWLAAVVAGLAISLVLTGFYGLVAGPPAVTSPPSAGVVVISLVSGFLAYLLGGSVAGKSAGYSGGLHGAMTAVFGLTVGLVVGTILAVFGATFAGGVAIPPANFGLARGVLLAGLLLFLANLFGGYVGGKLGEPSRPEVGRFG